MWWKKITGQNNLWVVLLDFFSRRFQSHVVIRGNDFDLIKWLGVHVECICCGFFHFQIMEFFLTMEEIRDILESDSNGKKETYSESDSDSEAQ